MAGTEVNKSDVASNKIRIVEYGTQLTVRKFRDVEALYEKGSTLNRNYSIQESKWIRELIAKG